jgi:hypothetical protein
MAPFPGNPANSLIQPERPENKNAGDSRRRECLMPPPQGITEDNPEHFTKEWHLFREIRRIL